MKDSKTLLYELREILEQFEGRILSPEIREKVLALVPAFETLRNLGKSIIPDGLRISARDRLLRYFLAYPGVVLNEKELAIVAGISEWARRVRELRVQFGWKIITGLTAKQMMDENDLSIKAGRLEEMSPNDYMLLSLDQDRDSAYRWNIANELKRRKGIGGKQKILLYLRANTGKQVTGEELSYVAGSKEWARRTRELRTEEGWPIHTKMSGNPSLPVGVYLLEKDRQAPAHDRHIPEGVRGDTLRRDNYTCQRCGWSYDLWNPSDPRFLELHHIQAHAEGGENSPENLITYCNVCHDEIHSGHSDESMSGVEDGVNDGR